MALVFEDVHWGRDLLVDTIEYLTGFITDKPVFIICASRPDLPDRSEAFGHVSTTNTVLALERRPGHVLEEAGVEDISAGGALVAAALLQAPRSVSEVPEGIVRSVRIATLWLRPLTSASRSAARTLRAR